MSPPTGCRCWHAAGVDPSQVALDFWVEPSTPQRLCAVAADLLADGHDSPSLREIINRPYGNVREVFEEALRELGVYVDGAHEARIRQVRRWSCQALNGTMSRADLVLRVRGLLEIDDQMPWAIRALGILCHGDADRFDDIVLGRALKDVVETLDK
jgi:hypothetical protein